MKKLTIIFLLPFFVSTLVTAQSTNSPYSFFGIGMIEDHGFGVNESMAGTGIALQSGSFLNRLNPASYSGIDSLSMLFEIGLFSRYTTYQTSDLKQDKFDGNISYLATGFRALKWWSISAGILPYSSMGYTIYSYDDIDGTDLIYAKTYKGTGSINKAYIGNSIQPFKNFSVGFHTSYIFGSFNQWESAVLNSSFGTYSIKKSSYIKAIKYDFGAQYFFQLKKCQYGIGVVYGNHKDLSSRSDLVFGHSIDTVELKQNEKSDFIIPNQLGFGISASYNRTLKVALDYEINQWSQSNYSNTLLKTRNSERYSMGVEYSPGAWDRKAFGLKKLNYRMGVNYNKSYLVIDNTPINSQSISMGIGIPLEKRLSMINLSIVAGQLGTTKNNLFKENYFQCNINFTIHDIWFQKPKYD